MGILLRTQQTTQLRMLSSLAPSLLLIGLTASLPQLPIPANRPGSVLTTNIIRPGVRGEVSSVRLVEEGDSDSLSGANLLNVLNNRIVTNNRASTLPARTRTRVFTTSLGSSSASSNSANDDGSNGPPMPYSFSYNVAGDETQTYMAREEESDGTTVTGSYSYVDPTGALITVSYTAGVMGYTETRERQEGYLELRPQSSSSSSKRITSSSSSTGSGSSRFSSSTSSQGQQQLTTTLLKKKTVDQDALIAKIIAALQPQLSTIVDNSIDEFETVTEEKTVTVEKLPTITSTFETFSNSQQS